MIGSSWPEEGAPLGLPWWAHLLLMAAVGLEIVFRVLKMTLSSKAIGLDVSFGVAARTVLGGDFAAAITPSRTGSEPARFLALTEARVPVAGALLVLFLELFLEMLSLMVIAAVIVFAFRESGALMGSLTLTIVVYSSAVLGAAAVAWSLSRAAADGPPPRWVRWIGIRVGGWRRIQQALAQLREGLKSLRTAKRGLMFSALVVSIIHVGFRLITLPIIVYSYQPAELVPPGPLVLWSLLLLYGASVAPAPGGGGMVELGFKLALGGTIPARLVAASLIWWRVYSFYVYVLIGALATGRTVMRALQRTSRAIEEGGGDAAGAGGPVAVRSAGSAAGDTP
ncbi:MAG: lysylphosphatidylglycerol synthase transmembrane domain-containing protein [Gemmatimonadota bacterium]